jgi:hypothetical protein
MSLALRKGRPFRGDGVTQQKAVVEKYTDGFRRGDLAQIQSCLSDDTVVGHGNVSLGGDPVDFVYLEVFTFTDGLVSRLDTFHIWLGEVPA